MIAYDKGEKIVKIVRRHSLAFTLETLFLIIAAILPYVAYLKGFDATVISFFNISNNPFFLNAALYTLWLLLLWILFFIAWSDFWLDAWIITDGRIIDVEQYGIFRRRINYYRIDKIQKINIFDRTKLEKSMNYGTLLINLGEDSFKMEEIKEPENLQELILGEQKKILNRLKTTVTFEEGK